jgi:glycosyltransferase involved in cell wall biosynthesis
MTPLVSILIPAYNAQAWIADSIKSAQAQTWACKEIIIVDDGSKDQTLSVARQFASKSVNVVSQPHQGAAAARNKAFALCHGDYVQWLDADDLLSSDKITRQMEAAERTQDQRVLISCGWGYFMRRPYKAKFISTPLWENLAPLEWLLRKWEHNVHMQTATWLVSRELTAAAGPWDTRLLGDDDGEYFSRAIVRSRGIHFVKAAKVFYRITNASRLSYIGQSNVKMDAQFLGMKMQIGYLQSLQDDERVRSTCITYLQNCLPHFYPNRPDIVEQAQQLANSLGGRLETPQLTWKYALIQKIFGWNAAKASQRRYNLWKITVRQAWDNAAFRLESRFSSGRH